MTNDKFKLLQENAKKLFEELKIEKTDNCVEIFCKYWESEIKRIKEIFKNQIDEV